MSKSDKPTMRYLLHNGLGQSIDWKSPERMRKFLDATDFTDEEHGAAWLADELGLRCLSYGGDVLSFEHKEAPPRHMPSVERERVIELWMHLAHERFEELEQEPWRPGYGPPLPPDELARRELEEEKTRLRDDRAFYEVLGPERADTTCRDDGCKRGRISQSIFCRVHHFESLRKRKCPFDD